MLGDLVIEERGQITTMRVLPGDGQQPQVEVSFQAAGKALGMDHVNRGTYTSMMRPDGTLIGEGQGIVMTATGERATWRGQGVGRFTGRGTGVSWRGALYLFSPSEKLSRLNGIALVYEHEADENGNIQDKLWEWK